MEEQDLGCDRSTACARSIVNAMKTSAAPRVIASFRKKSIQVTPVSLGQFFTARVNVPGLRS
jgi:hypothetical protein